ncbi:MAG: sugar-binding protein [Armatimonadota bacterium]|nr:sugar-binding protein [Armatimonadota bacterium]
MRKALAVCLLLTVSAVLTSCSTGKKVRVAFVTNNVSDFWKIAEAGVRQAEKDFDVQCDVRMPTQGTALEQKEILQDLLVKGVSGIAISPVSPDSQTEILNQVAKKVHLICHDSDAPKSNRLLYVGTSNYDAGKVAGEQLKKALPKGGKVMVYVGTLDAQNASQRYAGLKDAVKGSPIKILGVMTDNADHTKARANVEDTLVKHPDIAGLVGLWSYNGPAIVNAVKAAKKVGKVAIVCFDEDEVTLQGIKEGAIFATVVQKPYEFGYQSVKILAALARGQKINIPPTKIIDTGVEVINKDNVDAFWAKLKRLTGKA